MPKSVDEYLNEVNYDFEGYEPSEEVLKYINFIQLVGGEDLENKTPTVHLKIMEEVFKDKTNTAIMCSRGIGKTTVCVEFLILYIAAFGEFPGLGKIEFLIYVGDSIENGVKSLRKNIEHRYNNSEFLQKLIPNMGIKYLDNDENEIDISAGRKFTDVRFEFKNLRGDRLAVRLFGAKTGVRGTKEFGKRPQLALIDDILSDEDARSDTVINAIEDTIHKAVKYALNPKRSKTIWIGTPFNEKDPLFKIVESGAWNVACFPVCEKFPCSEDEFKGAWEDRFDYEYVKSSYEDSLAIGKVSSFNQELMLRITSEEELLLPSEKLVWFEKKLVTKNKDNFNFYITTDMSTSVKTNADYCVISVWAINNNGDYMLVDGYCKKDGIDNFIDKLFWYVSAYKPLGVGLEVSGQQGGFISWINKEMINRNVYFNLLSSNNSGQAGIRPVGDKFSRFILFMPRFEKSKVWFAKELKGSAWMNEFENERARATKSGFKSKHDDVLDTISMLGSFEVYLPSKETLPISEEVFEDEMYQIRNTVF